LFRSITKEWANREKVLIEFERRFGIGYYDDRRHRLDEMLDALDRDSRVDLDAVLAALWQAREARVDAMRKGTEIDFRRMVASHQRLIKATRNLLLKAEDSYLTFLEYSGPGASTALDWLHDFEHSLDLVETLKRLRKGLEDDPLRKIDSAGPFRRPQTGRQFAPWLLQVRERLGAAGVDDPEDTLLIAAGLVQYRSASTL
jgi:hypothetical protein